jgi:hypothetical protein
MGCVDILNLPGPPSRRRLALVRSDIGSILPAVRCSGIQWLLLLVLFCIACGGCVRRSITIESDPPGALVYLNSQEVGRTPMTRDFTWYGRYDLQLRMEGYETLKTTANVRPPLWQIPPVDLVAELWPFGLHDRQRFTYELEPLPAGPADPQAVFERAQQMREAALSD